MSGNQLCQLCTMNHSLPYFYSSTITTSYTPHPLQFLIHLRFQLSLSLTLACTVTSSYNPRPVTNATHHSHLAYLLLFHVPFINRYIHVTYIRSFAYLHFCTLLSHVSTPQIHPHKLSKSLAFALTYTFICLQNIYCTYP